MTKAQISLSLCHSCLKMERKNELTVNHRSAAKLLTTERTTPIFIIAYQDLVSSIFFNKKTHVLR